MKKMISIFFAFVIGIALTACSNQTEDNSVADNNEKRYKDNASKDILIVYFSIPETNQVDNMNKEEENSTVVIDGKVLGNTQYFATIIQEYTGGSIFRIEPVTPYPIDHNTLIELASDEQSQNIRPEIKTHIKHFEDYKTIFIGYPNWWGDMPMILYSFFDEYDFSGKTIIPFNTHGGSGFSNTIETIGNLEPNAVISEKGLSISRNDIQNSKAEIIKWLNTLIINEK